MAAPNGLKARLRDPTPSVRATVVSAIRYTFADTARSYDELLAPLIVDFLSLMVDEDLVRVYPCHIGAYWGILLTSYQTVRRLSLSALNAAARNKPHLIRDHLGALLPHLYVETVVNQQLIRVVQMGPWQHKVDDGLEARKTAYETMYTLVRLFILHRPPSSQCIGSSTRVSTRSNCMSSLAECSLVWLTKQTRSKCYVT